MGRSKERRRTIKSVVGRVGRCRESHHREGLFVRGGTRGIVPPYFTRFVRTVCLNTVVSIPPTKTRGVARIPFPALDRLFGH